MKSGFTMPSLSLRIPNLSESLEHQLESMILSGIFWPQTALPSERRLAEELDVSRTSVRNALAGLCEKKLLMPAKRGYLVSSAVYSDLTVRLNALAPCSLEAMFLFWSSLAEDVVQIATEKAKNSDRVAISTCLEDFQKSLVSGDLASALTAHKLLWKALTDATYNFFIGQTIEALIEALTPYFESAFEAKNCAADLGEVYSGLAGMSFSSKKVVAAYKAYVPFPQRTGHLGAEVMNSQPSEALVALISAILRQPYAFESVFELRLLTEKRAARWAATKITDRGKATLAAQLRRMSFVVDEDRLAYSKMDSELHAMIAELSGNPVTLAIHQCLNPIFSRTTDSWLKTHFDILNDYSIIHLQHQKVVAAILNGDKNAANNAMDEHLAYVLDTLHRLRLSQHYGYVSLARQIFN